MNHSPFNHSLKLDKKRTLCNVSNSILKHYGVETFHTTYKPLDKILKNTSKEKICLILFDALGKAIIDRYQEYIPFIFNHVYKEFKSVFPPTTVAATTSLTTGRYPIENGYLGWTMYFKNYDKLINVFPSNNKLNSNEFIKPAVQYDLLKTKYIWDLINEHDNSNTAANIMSFDVNDSIDPIINLKNYFNKTNDLLKNHKFIYSYCTEPDHTMHLTGVKSFNTKDMIILLNNELEKLVNNNPDTLFILVADHGMIDVNQEYTHAHDDFCNSLNNQYFAIEPRFATFKVKDKPAFVKAYNEHYAKLFLLKSKEEILENHTFGYGKPNQYALDSMGDYFLIAKNISMLNDGYAPQDLVANHAGCTKQETQLYMSLFNN